MDILTIQVDCRPYARDGPPQLGITVEAPYSRQRSKKQEATTKESYQNHDYQNLDNCTTVYDGLQITKIQPGSIIDRVAQFKVGDVIVECNGVNLQRPFAEAQRTLKQFVVEKTSQRPLVMKVLRKATSSSSIPSTSGSQTTVIDKENIFPKGSPQKSPQAIKPKVSTMPQQVFQTTSGVPASQISMNSSIKPTRHLADAPSMRKQTIQHTVKLKKGPEGGFGIKIAERDNMHCAKNRPICVTAILASGAAHRDGRLREGDILLKINGYDLEGVPQHEVTRTLRAVGIGHEVEFIVARQELATEEDIHDVRDSSKDSIDNDCDKSLIDLSVPEQDDSVFESSSNHQFEKKIDSLLNIPIRDGPGIYEYDIPLNDTKSAGLGLYLKYPRRADELKDLGIWIEKVITGGAAWKDGRLQPDDQILGINGIDLVELSNAEASDTLTAAVVRGIGPEATPNTIRLKIHRRDPLVVAKILQGTNNRIECSDVITNGQEKTLSIFDKTIENSCESYQTAIEGNQNRTGNYRDSSDSSNQNSQNDSAISNQHPASNSIKLTNSYHRSTDETTSGAISPITNSVSIVPSIDIPESTFQEQHCNDQIPTQPKSIYSDVNSDLKVVDCTSSSLSLDDESSDANGVDHFQRDGYSRRSMSEKKHAQLSAETDTFRRNQLLRKEREQQRQLEEQLARQRLDDDRHRSYQQVNQIQKLPQSYTTNEFRTIYGSHSKSEQLIPSEHRIADSITSTSNDECFLINSNVINGNVNGNMDSNSNSNINNINGGIITTNSSHSINNTNINNNRGSKNASVENTPSTHKKSSSLLTKFLKFGSMKRKKKTNNVQPQQEPAAQQSNSKNPSDSRCHQTGSLRQSSQQARHKLQEHSGSQSMGLTVRPVAELYSDSNARFMVSQRSPSPQTQYTRFQNEQQPVFQVPRARPSIVDVAQVHQQPYLGPALPQMHSQYDMLRQPQYSSQQRLPEPMLNHNYRNQSIATNMVRPSGHWSSDLEVLDHESVPEDPPNQQFMSNITTAQQFMKQQLHHQQNHLPQPSLYQHQQVQQHLHPNHSFVDAHQAQISMTTQYSPPRQSQFANQLDQLVVMPTSQQALSQNQAMRPQIPLNHLRLPAGQQPLPYLPNRPVQPPRYHCPVGHPMHSMQHAQQAHLIDQQQPGYQVQMLRPSQQPQSQSLYNTIGRPNQQAIQVSQAQIHHQPQQPIQYSHSNHLNNIYHQNGIPADPSMRRFQTLPPRHSMQHDQIYHRLPYQPHQQQQPHQLQMPMSSNSNGVTMHDKSRVVGEPMKSSEFYIY